jgi:hypothetical protein
MYYLLHIYTNKFIIKPISLYRMDGLGRLDVRYILIIIKHLIKIKIAYENNNY